MDVRSPLGTLLIVAVAVAALFINPGLEAWLGELSAPQAGVSRLASPGATTLSVAANTPTRYELDGWSDLLGFALTGRLPNEPLEATVSLDGRRLGATPLLERPVEPGGREVGLTRSGYIGESLAVELRADTAHRLDLTLFPLAAAAPRDRHLAEQAFFARIAPIYLALLYLVVGFHAVSLLNFFRGRLAARLGLAALHVPIAALVWFPLTRLLVAFETPHWLAFAMASALVGLLPLFLHPGSRRGGRASWRS